MSKAIDLHSGQPYKVVEIDNHIFKLQGICSKCSYSEIIGLNAYSPPQLVLKIFHSRGWFIDKSKMFCVSCMKHKKGKKPKSYDPAKAKLELENISEKDRLELELRRLAYLRKTQKLYESFIAASISLHEASSALLSKARAIARIQAQLTGITTKEQLEGYAIRYNLEE